MNKQFWNRNGSTILTILGGIGVIGTAVLAVKATPKAMKLVEEAKEEKGEELTKWEIVKVTGPAYIPAGIVGLASVGCIFGANILNKKTQASMASAYALLDQSFKEYKRKVVDVYGSEADQKVRAEIAKDHYDDDDFAVVPEEDDGKILFYDQFSHRYFRSTMEDVLKAEYNTNRQLAVNTGVYLNEFYEFLDLAPITAGKELGWSTGILESHYWASWIEFDHEKFETDDGLEGYIISMRYEPVIDFAYY